MPPRPPWPAPLRAARSGILATVQEPTPDNVADEVSRGRPEGAGLAAFGVHALAVEVAIRGSDGPALRYLRHALGDLHIDGEPAERYRLDRSADGDNATLCFEASGAPEETLVDSAPVAQAIAVLLWDLNRRVVEASPRWLRLHAAGACRGDQAVLLPAAMESGKTTLVAGLLQRGFDYLSDEVVALGREDLRAVPYPKPLSVDPGSWEVLGDLEPAVEPGVRPLLPRQWQVPASSIGARVADPGASPAVVVFPRYDPALPTRLQPLPAAEVAMRLVDCVFAFDGQADLPAIGRIAERCPGYHLDVSDLAAACDLVEEALRTATSPTRVTAEESEGPERER